MLRKLFWIFVVITVLFVGFLGSVLALNARYVNRMSYIIPAFYAKEMCSCLYVVGQKEEICHHYAGETLAMVGHIELDHENKTVIAEGVGFWMGMGQRVKGKYVNERFGCKIIYE